MASLSLEGERVCQESNSWKGILDKWNSRVKGLKERKSEKCLRALVPHSWDRQGRAEENAHRNMKGSRMSLNLEIRKPVLQSHLCVSIIVLQNSWLYGECTGCPSQRSALSPAGQEGLPGPVYRDTGIVQIE